MNSDQLGGIRAWVSWALAVSFVMMVFALQTGYAVTNTYVADSLALSIVQVGIVGSIYTWVFAIAQFASGAILDRFGSRVLPIACLTVALGAFAFANAPNIIVLLMAQVLIALGASFGFIGAGFVGGVWFQPIKYGLMFSLVQFVASSSAVAGQQAINYLIEGLDWRQLTNGMAAITLAVAVMLFLFIRDTAQVRDAREKAHPWQGFGPLLSGIVHSVNEVTAIKDSWINCLIGGATFGAMLALGVVWGPRVLVGFGLSPGDANIATSMSWFGLALGAPAFSWLSDRMQSRKKPMLGACVMQLCVILVFMVLEQYDFATSSVLFFLWGFSAGGSMIPFAIAADLVSKSLIGTSAAIVNATQFIIGGILMALPGRILSGEGPIGRLAVQATGSPSGAVSELKWALVVYPLALVLALCLFLFLSETYPRTDRQQPDRPE